MKTLDHAHRPAPADDYLKLIYEFPLRAIRSSGEHAEAVRVLGRLLGRPDGRLSPGQRDYSEVLGRLINDYGKQKRSFPRRQHTPLQILRFLMDEHTMNVTALGGILGNKTAASLVLSGQRELSKSHIRLLADHFSVDPGLFI